jgi:uncharacterized membrane protein
VVGPDVEGSGETKLETIISYLLVAGVLASLVLEVSGIILFYRAHASLAISQDKAMFLSGQNFFAFLLRLHTERSSTGIAILLMTLGVAVLLLTPYIRVILSVLYFAFNKNLKYFVITLFVLLVLTASLMMH